MSHSRRAAFLRLVLVAAAVLAIAALTWLHGNWLAVPLGILGGTAFLLWGMAEGGSLGNARAFGQSQADVNTRIGICLAAAGLASYALGHEPPFPLPFRIFYAVILAAVGIVALVLAIKAAREAG